MSLARDTLSSQGMAYTKFADGGVEGVCRMSAVLFPSVVRMHHCVGGIINCGVEHEHCE